MMPPLFGFRRLLSFFEKKGAGRPAGVNVKLTQRHVHGRREHPGYEVPEVLRSVCVFPQRDELAPLVAHLRQLGLSHVTSIGAGECFLEGLLESEGFDVTCVDIDIFAAMPAVYDSFHVYTRTGVVTRLAHGAAVHDLECPSQTALLFSFGKRLPWLEYVRRYDRALPAIIVIGDERDDESACTQPTAYALRSLPESADGGRWTVAYDGPCRAVMKVRLVTYVRTQH